MSTAVRAPGKVVLAGEYAVLAGAPALVAAVDRHAIARFEPAAGPTLRLVGRSAEAAGVVEGLRLRFPGSVDPQIAFAARAAELAAAFLLEKGEWPGGGTLTITDNLHQEGGPKLGLGSSAAVSAAVAGCLFAAAGRKPELDDTRRLVFSLSMAAHRSIQQNEGSGVDLAASVYGGVLEYRMCDPAPLLHGFESGMLASVADRMASPDITRMDVRGLQLWLVPSGVAASTPQLIGKVRAYARAEPRAFADFVARSAAAVQHLAQALTGNDSRAIATSVEDARAQLLELARGASFELEAPAHRRAIELASVHGFAGKTSGAGAGDCAVLLGLEGADTAGLRTALSAAGCEAIAVDVDTKGLCEA